MNKQELVEVFKDLHPEDTSGEIIGEVYLDDGTRFKRFNSNRYGWG